MIVGLTGGIGSGKSIVASLFKILGASVFNSDDNAKLQYFKPEVKKKVIQLLGTDAYLNDTAINRVFISSKIFSDTNTLHALNNIIHPAVAADFHLFVQEHAGSLIIKESAILIETGLFKQLQKNILVVAPMAIRIERLMKRDHLNEEEIKKRFNSQLNDAEKEKHCDIIIRNNEQELLMPQVITVFNALIHA